MKSGIPWNLKRVDEETRQAVIDAARRSGVTVGEWLNQVLAPDGIGYAEPEETKPAEPPARDLAGTLGQLKNRLDEIERNLKPAADRIQKSVPEMVADLAREIENPDEKARSSVEGLRARAAAPAVRPQTGADRVSDAIRDLDRQIAEMGRRVADPPPPRADANPTGLDDIRYRLNALLAEAPQPIQAPSQQQTPQPAAAAVEAALKALEARIDEAKAELGEREAEHATGEQIARLETQLAEIGNRLTATETKPARNDAELATAVREISAHQRTIDDRAETIAMRRDQKALSAAMAALRADIAELGERVSAIGRLGAEDHGAFFDLARRIDALAAETPVDRNLLSVIRSDLDTLRAIVEGGRPDELAEQMRSLLAASPSRKQIERLGEEITSLRQAFETDDSPRTIKRLEARMVDIGRSLEALVDAQQASEPNPVLEQLEERLREISGNIEWMRDSSMPAAVTAAVTAAQRQLNGRLEDVMSQLGGVFATMPRQAATLEAVQERLQAVVERIDGLSRARHEPSKAFDAIKAEIRALRAEVAERPGAASVDTEHLEAQVRELAAHLETVVMSTPDAGALISLEQQVEQLAGEMEAARPRVAAVSDLEQNLARLQTLLADTTRESVAGARAEAEKAVTQLSESVAHYEIDSDLVRGLTRDLEALRNAAASSDEITRAQLEAVSGTVAEVVDRLSRLERESVGVVRGEGRPADSGSKKAQGPAAAILRPEVAMPAAASAQPTVDRRADFIAAARRAAKAAADQAPADQVSAPRIEVAVETAAPDLPQPSRKPGAFARISQAIRNRKRPLLLAAAAIVVAVGAMAIYGRLGTETDQGALTAAAAVAPPQPAAPVEPVNEVVVEEAAPKLPAPQASEQAMVPPSATPSAAIAFAEPEVMADRFEVEPQLPPTASFGARAAQQNADGNHAADDQTARPEVTLASERNEQAAGFASTLDRRLGSERLLQAAESGDPVAAFEIARRYSDGALAPKDLSQAAAWYRRAAEGGVAVAQYRIASLYERGQGVAQSRVDAVNWYQRAADQGNVNAMHNLAVMMSEGVEAPPDHAKALQWFLAAGNYGVRDSQYNLGVIYARGLGPAQDLAESYMWFAIAASQGDTDAAARRDEVAKAMSPDELAGAKAAVAAWHVQPTLAEANGVSAPPGGWDEPGDGIAVADREALVRKIQVLLAEQGYDPGPADGVIGPKTVDAVRAYQRRIGQPETGRIDNTLVAALDNGEM